MPPKSASTAAKARRSSRITTRKSNPEAAPKSSPTTNEEEPAISPPPVATNIASPEPSQKAKLTKSPNTKSNSKNPLHVSPVSENLEKTLFGMPELLKSDIDENNDNNKVDPETPVEPEMVTSEDLGHGRNVLAEAVTTAKLEDGSKNGVTVTSAPPEARLKEDETLVDPKGGMENVASGEVGTCGGKRRIVKKTVRVVKKVIKKRVPKRVLTDGLENVGSQEKAESEAILNDMMEKSCLANEVVENSHLINEVRNNSNITSEVMEKSDFETDSSNLMNDVTKISTLDNSTEVMENSHLINEVRNNSNITSEGMKKSDLETESSILMNEVTKTSILDNSTVVQELAEVQKDDNLGCFDLMQTENATSNVVVTPKLETCDLKISLSDSIKVQEVSLASEDTMEGEKAEVMAVSVTDHSPTDLVLENQNLDVVENKNVGLIKDQTLGPAREAENVGLICNQNEDPVGETGNCKGDDIAKEILESDSSGFNEGLLLSGEMEALERKKRRKREIFVGGLDKDTKEEDIRKVFEGVGEIVHVRLVMNSKTGKNKGFAFVRFATAVDAKKALEKHSKVEICGKQCGASLVEGNDTIFLGNINREWKTADVANLLVEADIEKLDKVTIKADPNNTEHNRGFAFVEFETIKDAQIAFGKLQKKDVFEKHLKIKVAWAQPLIEPDEEDIFKVKSVYAEYLPSSWDEEKVYDYFKRFGEIENVVLAKNLPASRRKDFAFVNYTNRQAALACIEAFSKEQIEDSCSKVKVKVSLAKPMPKRKQMKHVSSSSIKQLPKEKPKAPKPGIKRLHEPSINGNYTGIGYEGKNVAVRSTTTNELVHILRQQASNNQIPPGPSIGSAVPDHHFRLTGSKRPFSLVAHDPMYMEARGLPRPRVESSYPIADPSVPLRGVDMASVHYYHQQGPGYAAEPIYGRENYPSHLQTRERGPFYANTNIYRRY